MTGQIKTWSPSEITLKFP